MPNASPYTSSPINAIYALATGIFFSANSFIIAVMAFTPFHGAEPCPVLPVVS